MDRSDETVSGPSTSIESKGIITFTTQFQQETILIKAQSVTGDGSVKSR